MFPQQNVVRKERTSDSCWGNGRSTSQSNYNDVRSSKCVTPENTFMIESLQHVLLII